MEDIFDMNDSMGSPLDEINPLGEINTDHLLSPLGDGDDTLGVSHSNPFSSGFDAEHPMPTIEELRNAGFSGETAAHLVYGIHDYSERELFHCFYESEDPHEAFLELERQKMRELIFRTDQNIKEAEDLLRRLPY